MKTKERHGIILALAATTLLLAASCNKEEAVPFSEVEVPGMQCVLNKVDDLHLVVINSQQECDALFPECRPNLQEVDFNKQTLFAVKGEANNCIIDKQITCTRKGKQVLVGITIEEGDCTSVEAWQAIFATKEKIKAEDVSLAIH